MTDQSPPSQVPFTDRSIWLIVFGVFEILLGLFFALMVPLLVVSQAMVANTPNAPEPLPMNQMVFAAIFYMALAALFLGIGYGSIRSRRWARGLMLIFSSIWLVGGVLSLVFLCFALPEMHQAIARQQGKPLPAGTASFMQFLTLAISSVIYIIVPGAFVLFYGSRHVKATCEWKDPTPRWTDRKPLPVLAMSLILAYGAVCTLSCIPMYNATVPFFGTILSGFAGAIILVIVSAFWGYLALEFYRLKPFAWWAVLISSFVFLISSSITFLRIGLAEFYRHMGMPAEQIEMVEHMKIFSTGSMIFMMTVSMLIYYGFLLFLYKYFRKAPENGS